VYITETLVAMKSRLLPIPYMIEERLSESYRNSCRIHPGIK